MSEWSKFSSDHTWVTIDVVHHINSEHDPLTRKYPHNAHLSFLLTVYPLFYHSIPNKRFFLLNVLHQKSFSIHFLKNNCHLIWYFVSNSVIFKHFKYVLSAQILSGATSHTLDFIKYSDRFCGDPLVPVHTFPISPSVVLKMSRILPICLWHPPAILSDLRHLGWSRLNSRQSLL